MNFILVFIGGGIGSLLRYALGRFFSTKFFALGYFPFGTLCVNLLGSFLIGFVGYFVANKLFSDDFRIFFIIGILGGFTTFSSFGLEVFNMLEHKDYLKMILYVLGTNFFGIILVSGGWWLSKTIQGL
ncbi:camphor resistance protein CrcB [Helicobacter sp. 13S00482-2]|uniref:fluoride efflux transporter CrcB n=1 Tax=Helicobacter sp. 13S00482-2 TaxID=1476200 RepID=UPI000BA79089|nr:fluoride efflux transporter CrcB [Helicobacter sp. 13S00482-2]PAF53876.1 camphor resistance protein CrcB [Helicobacter sp. 13S00482-2]